MITEAQILESLSLLGDSPDEIAQHLLDKGCLARYCRNYVHGALSNCPLAVYLQQQFPGKRVLVSGRIIIYSTANHIETDLRTPQPFLKFINRFDEGEYPFLYAQEG